MQPYYIIAIAVAVLALALIAALWRRAALSGAGLEQLRDDKAGLERQLAIEQQRNARLSELQQELAESRREAHELRATREALQVRLATVEETLAQERAQGAEKLRLLEDARERMSAEFRLLADAVMQRQSESFTRQNKEQIEAILKPVGDKLAEFQDGLHAARREGVEIRTALEQQIKNLTGATERTTREAERLAKALKSEPKTQGAWGELVLEWILDASGLRKGNEYEVQTSHSAEDGRWVRPDVVVHLPREGKIVVDSKVSLTAFEEYANCEAEEQKHDALARHVVSLRRHIDELAGKSYHTATGSGLDFVIMFVPNEGALAAALDKDRKLAEYAVSKDVAIATPTTLMIALRTVHSVWQAERRTLNAEQIADRAGKLYDKFFNFVEDMKKISKSLDQARHCYDAAYNKLWEGNGNLVWQAHQLKELGARATKALPAELLAIAQVDEPAAAPAEPA